MKLVRLACAVFLTACGDSSAAVNDDGTGTTGTTGSTTTESTTGDPTTSTSVDSTGTVTTDASTTDATSSSSDATASGSESSSDSSGSDSSSGSSGSSDSSGSSSSSSTGNAGICGDGTIDADETCDDNNTDPGDSCSMDCQTANCLVPISHATIQAGEDDANCPIVYITPGTYTENVVVDRDVEFQTILAGTATVDGGAQGSTFETTAGTVSLVDMRITGGEAATGGGINNSTDLTLTDCQVDGNLATADTAAGGGIYNGGGALTLVDSVVDQNAVEGTNALFTSADGGGIASFGGTVALDNVVVSQNTALSAATTTGTARGAGIFVNAAGSLDLQAGTVIDGNVATADADAFGIGPGGHLAAGGGVYVAGGFAFDSVQITMNEANATTTLITTATTARGGGLHCDSCSMGGFLSNLTVDTNTASATGDNPLAQGGGLYLTDFAAAFLDFIDVTNNLAQADTTTLLGTAEGGGVYVTDYPFNMTIVVGTFSGNVAEVLNLGSVGGAGGAFYLSDTAGLILRRVVGHDNRADRAGGFLFWLVSSSTNGVNDLLINNSTISQNTSDRGAGIRMFAGAGDYRTEFSSCTFTGNSGTVGSGLSLQSVNAGSTAEFRNTILYGNIATTDAECETLGVSTLSSDGYNMLGTIGAGCTVDGDATGNQSGVDPMLGALQDNGGPTVTHAIASGSAARNNGNPGGCVDQIDLPLAVDQRGEDRDTEGTCDVGAYEYVP